MFEGITVGKLLMNISTVLDHNDENRSVMVLCDEKGEVVGLFKMKSVSQNAVYSATRMALKVAETGVNGVSHKNPFEICIPIYNIVNGKSTDIKGVICLSGLNDKFAVLEEVRMVVEKVSWECLDIEGSEFTHNSNWPESSSK